MAIKKVVKSSVSQQVFDQLREQILSGSWKPGQKLPSENELAAQFGVSRVTVRNALQKLSGLGLLETRFGEGSFVRGAGAQAALNQLGPMLYLGQETLRDILTFRRMVEGPICEIACRRATDREIAGLRQLVDQMERAVGDLAAFARLDSAFHEQLAQLTRSAFEARESARARQAMEQSLAQTFWISTVYQNVVNMESAWPDRVAVRDSDEAAGGVREILYKEYAADIRRMVGWLQRSVPQVQGRHIGLLAPSGYPYAVAIFGCILTGAVAVPLNSEKSWPELAAELDRADVDCLLTDGSYAAREPDFAQFKGQVLEIGAFARCTELAQLSECPDQDALALILFTSDTTGRSKGVMLSQRNLFAPMPAFCDPFRVMLEQMGVKVAYELDLSLARGLNYYTGAIFEVKALDVAMGSICGGGRYDDLTGVFGMKGLSGVGISFGADRIYDVLNDLGLYPERTLSGTEVLFVNFGSREQAWTFALASALRREGISVEIYPSAAKLQKQFSYADNLHIPFVVVLGEKEQEAGQVLVKDMKTGTQEAVDQMELPAWLKARL